MDRLYPDIPHTPANAQLDAVMVVISRKLGRKQSGPEPRTSRVLIHYAIRSPTAYV